MGMKASFTLLLEDKLTAGMKKIGQAFVDLRKTGNELGLGKLERGADFLRTVGQEVKNLTSELRTVEAVADRAWAAMKRMGSVGFQGVASTARNVGAFGKRALGEGGLIGAATAAGGAYALMKPAQSYGDLSNILRHSAITAHKYGPDADLMMASQRGIYQRTAIETAQPSHKIAESGFWMSLTGMAPEIVQQMTPLSARIATAYKADVGEATKTAFALNYSLGIGTSDMERAMGMLALMGKHGHFLFSDQAKYAPGVFALGGMQNMKGMKGLEELGAAMQISMKVVDPSQPNMAAHNLEQFLGQIQQSREEKTFKKYGADLDAILMDAAGKGISPMEATLRTIRKIQNNYAKAHHITDPRKRNQANETVLSGVLGGRKEAFMFAGAMLEHWDEYEELKGLGRGVHLGMIGADYNEAKRDISSQNHIIGEVGTQVEDRLGRGFEPIIGRLAELGTSFVANIGKIDDKFPGLIDSVLVVTGSMIALGAALAAIGVVGPAIGTGIGIAATGIAGITNPFTAIAALPALLMAKAWSERHEGEDVNPNTQVPYFDPNGIPAYIAPDQGGAGSANELHVRVSTDPGTDAKIISSTPGMNIRLDPGTTTTRE